MYKIFALKGIKHCWESLKRPKQTEIHCAHGSEDSLLRSQLSPIQIDLDLTQSQWKSQCIYFGGVGVGLTLLEFMSIKKLQ